MITDTALLEKDLNYRFKNRRLLERALTHSTYAYEHPDLGVDNERLEFLGDAVLQLVISEALYAQSARLPEGDMTKKRALVVCEQTLASVAGDIGLGTFLRFGRGELGTGGPKKLSNLSNALEALFGAVYLDGGIEEARRVILLLLASYLEEAIAGRLIYDFKSRLLELVQSTRGTSRMHFEIVGEEGPVHDRTFTARVVVDDQDIAEGRGSSKKDAEQQAARRALGMLSCTRDGCTVID